MFGVRVCLRGLCDLIREVEEALYSASGRSDRDDPPGSHAGFRGVSHARATHGISLARATQAAVRKDVLATKGANGSTAKGGSTARPRGKDGKVVAPAVRLARPQSPQLGTSI